jgi:threonine/homoserine/homoserine lactone efflux protein
MHSMHESLAPLILFAAVMSLTPGPNVILVTASAANFGFGRTIPQMVGLTLGFGVLVMAVGLGLAGALHAEPRLHTGLRYAGGAYLLYLAWCIARADTRCDADARAKPIGFFEAALFQLINPKGWVFAVGALAAYTTVGGDVLWETSVIAAVNAGACLGSVVIWAAFGAVIGRLLGNPRARRAFNWSMAGLLVVSLIPVFW